MNLRACSNVSECGGVAATVAVLQVPAGVVTASTLMWKLAATEAAAASASAMVVLVLGLVVLVGKCWQQSGGAGGCGGCGGWVQWLPPLQCLKL